MDQKGHSGVRVSVQGQDTGPFKQVRREQEPRLWNKAGSFQGWQLHWKGRLEHGILIRGRDIEAYLALPEIWVGKPFFPGGEKLKAGLYLR